MKKTGAWLVRYALEQLPVSHTFGIPGMQNTEIYDELDQSERITPVLVTHEQSASFACDGLARSSNRVGVCLVVPGAGVSNAMSGICEARLDGIPLLVIAGSARLDTGKSFQLHQLDQQELVRGAVKKSWRIARHAEIVSAIFDAYNEAVSGCPGPCFIEIPVEIQMLLGEVGDSLPRWEPLPVPSPDATAIAAAAELIKKAKHPMIYAGWGCHLCPDELRSLAELLEAPVALTMQGYGVFPGTHPLHAGMGFGASAVPAGKIAFELCDCLIAVGLRFAEVATGSYGIEVPENLIHIDIDPSVFDRNYPAKVKIAADARLALAALADALADSRRAVDEGLRSKIREAKEKYYSEWISTRMQGVNPARFIRELGDAMSAEDYVLSDVGNHTFLMAEHFTVKKAGHFIAPCDFNCMGYATPAAIGVKLANPGSVVAAVVGDGDFLMTCMESLTAQALGLGIVYCVFHDGELAQISQSQQLPYNRKTCTVLPDYDISGIAAAVGAEYIEVKNDEQIASALSRARELAASGGTAIVDVRVSYEKKTSYTQGVLKTNLLRFPVAARIRLVGRVVRRKFLPFI
jgi:acetolactate synthase-1/2/3 large subunit